MIRCIIVDDEPLAQDVLETYIYRMQDLVLVSICDNALEAFKALHDQEVDLIFLDIQMPGINGIDFIRSLKNPPAIIFTTAFSEYAVSGFDLEAIDYLLKPITYERFEKAIHKFQKIYIPAVIDIKDYTYFKVSGKLLKVLHADLLYAQSVKDYILISTTTGNYLTHMTMKYLNSLLPPRHFVRVHRSYIVNKAHVSMINRINLKIGFEVIPIGENYRANVKQIT